MPCASRSPKRAWTPGPARSATTSCAATAGAKRLCPRSLWRVLKRRGFVAPQPQKRPRCSFIRSAAELPNERWQADTTHWALADGTDVEVLNFIDDHSRLCVASRAFLTTKAGDVVATFQAASKDLGTPASLLSDNGAIFTGESRGGRCAIETMRDALGVAYRHLRPYHPQTCGKVERFHQTLKRWLAKQKRPADLAQLQALLDRFREYYNNLRPHRAIGRRTPAEAYSARAKAFPKPPSRPLGTTALRQDRTDKAGKVTLRYQGRLRHIGVGRAYAGTKVQLDEPIASGWWERQTATGILASPASALRERVRRAEGRHRRARDRRAGGCRRGQRPHRRRAAPRPGMGRAAVGGPASARLPEGRAQVRF